MPAPKPEVAGEANAPPEPAPAPEPAQPEPAQPADSPLRKDDDEDT